MIRAIPSGMCYNVLYYYDPFECLLCFDMACETNIIIA